jgi:hypothetical protein
MKMELAPDKARPKWPAEPYRGLSYYGPEHALLFVGRERDVDDCTHFLAERSTRILLLHGQTGCGKSSFLRAGLIPNLEERGFGYQFLREADPDDPANSNKPVFIRSGRDPIAQIAEQVFFLISRKYETPSAAGMQTIDLSKALANKTTLKEFVAACGQPAFLLKALSEVSERLLHTLILVLDQAEEVLTLTRPEDHSRQQFFRFLQAFNSAGLNIKFVIALRREDFGEFLSYIQLDASVKSDIKHFLLQDLSGEEILQAIKLPTERSDRFGYGAPFDIYKFEYAEGLPERILDDLFRALPAGGVPMVMQIVCQDLYNEIRIAGDTLIDNNLYEKRKGLAGIVDQRLSTALLQGFQYCHVPSSKYETEERNWRRTLYKIVRRNSDGTARTDEVSGASLRTWLVEADLQSPVDPMLSWLTDPQRLILRNRLIGGQEYFTLGHDAIGLALHEWAVRERALSLLEEERKRRLSVEQRASRFAVRMIAAIVLVVLLGAGAFAGLYLTSQATKVGVLVAAAKRLLPSDYSQSAWAAVQASRAATWLPRLVTSTLPEQPIATLAKVIAAGPTDLIPSGNGQISLLGGTSGEVVMWDREKYIDIKRVPRGEPGGHEDGRRMDLSAYIQGRGWSLRQAARLDDGTIVLTFDRDGIGRETSSNIIEISPDKGIRSFSSQELVTRSDALKTAMIRPLVPNSARNARILVQGRAIYVFTFAPDLVLDLFMLDDSAPLGLRHGAALDATAMSKTPDRELNRFSYHPMGNFLIIQEHIEEREQGRPSSALQRGHDRVFDILDLLGVQVSGGPKPLWTEIASKNALLTECEAAQGTCDIEALWVNTENTPLMVLHVTRANTAQKQGSDDLIIIDTKNNNRAVDISISLLTNLRPAAPVSNVLYDNVIAAGNADDLLLGLLAGQSSYYLYRVIRGNPTFIGTIAWKDGLDSTSATADLGFLMASSSGSVLGWDVRAKEGERSALLDRENMLGTRPVSYLIETGCSLGLFQSVPSLEEWRVNTGLESAPVGGLCR